MTADSMAIFIRLDNVCSMNNFHELLRSNTRRSSASSRYRRVHRHDATNITLSSELLHSSTNENNNKMKFFRLRKPTTNNFTSASSLAKVLCSSYIFVVVTLLILLDNNNSRVVQCNSIGTVGQGIKIVLPDQSGLRPETVKPEEFAREDESPSGQDVTESEKGNDINSATAAEFLILMQKLAVAEQQQARHRRNNVNFNKRTRSSSNSPSFGHWSWEQAIRSKRAVELPLSSVSAAAVIESESSNKRAAMVMPAFEPQPVGSTSNSLPPPAAVAGNSRATTHGNIRAQRNEPIGYPGCGIQHYKPNYLLNALTSDADAPNHNGVVDVGTLRAKRRVEAQQHSWPWQADLFFYRTMPDGTRQRAHLCGATLVDRWHVVTAAHCNISRLAQPLFGEVPTEYYVRLGQHRRSAQLANGAASPSSSALQEIRVKHWRDHELFNDSVTYAKGGEMQFFLYNDIAFLTLERPANLSPEIYPICLDFEEQPVFDVGSTCYASGWSLDEFDYDKWLRGDYSDVLNESKSKIADVDYCRKHHGGFNDTVTLCTKYAQGHYSCHGDSGGPLQCESNGRFFLVGIVSYDVATSCRETGMTFFSRISGLQNWIEARLVEDMLSL